MTSRSIEAKVGYRVAVLSPAPTSPDNFGNRKRIYNTCKALKARGAHVAFILYALEDDWRRGMPHAALEQMRADWDEVHIVVPTVPYHPSPKAIDHTIDEWWDPGLEAFLRWYFAGVRPEAFIVNYTYLSKALEFAPSTCCKILDTHDQFGGRREMLASLGIRPEFFHTTVGEEAIGVGRADVVLAIKEEEQAYFESLTKHPVLTLPYFEPSRLRVRRSDADDGYVRFGIIGAANNVNRTNISRFLDIAIPLFNEYMAPITIVIAGTMCRDLEHYGREHCVELLGPVDSVNEFYDCIDVAVVPMDQSSGQKIKVGEALGHGVPVVSHSHAFEGYPPTHRAHRLQSMVEIARTCIDLSFEPARIDTLEAATQTSQRALQARVTNAVEAIFAHTRRSADVSLFIIDASKLAVRPGLAFHIVSMMQFASGHRRVYALIRGGEPAAAGGAFFRECGRVARIIVEGPMPAASVAHHDCSQCSLADILEYAREGEIWCYDESALSAVAESGLQAVGVEGFTEGVSFPPPPFRTDVRTCFANGALSREPDRNCFKVSAAESIAIWPYDVHLEDKFLPARTGDGAEEIAVIFVGPTVPPQLMLVISALSAHKKNAVVVECGGLDTGILRSNLQSLKSYPTQITIKSIADGSDILKFQCTHLFDLTDEAVDHLSTLELLRFIARRQGRSDQVWSNFRTRDMRFPAIMRDLFDYIDRKNRWSFDRRHGYDHPGAGLSYLYNRRTMITLR